MVSSKDFIRVPLEKITTTPTKSGCWRLIRDHWWCVDSEENVLFYKRLTSPQCNTNKNIAERLISLDESVVNVVFINYAWIRHDCEDYV